MTRFSDRLIALFLFLTAVGLFIVSASFPDPGQDADPGTAALPRIISVGLAVLAVLLFIRAEPTLIAPPREARFRSGAMVLATIAYALLLSPLGFVLATVAFMVAALYLMGVRKPIPLVAMPIALALLVYVLFTAALSVYLPQGLLEGIIS